MVGEMAIFRQLLGALFAMVAIAQMTGCPFRFNVVVSSPSCNRVRGTESGSSSRAKQPGGTYTFLKGIYRPAQKREALDDSFEKFHLYTAG